MKRNSGQNLRSSGLSCNLGLIDIAIGLNPISDGSLAKRGICMEWWYRFAEARNRELFDKHMQLDTDL